ncbi:uncharacterized protein BJ171DRAFT_579169 [Polychytrium aggregatum]|uniref:uncharacterized protein n=1 Tax=Polychytrium aggregatum TaxID=110093 RepID=UPI0022FEF323|nr:uncharacterized protein BJ171DRAFT_579169 [Polychytrium aggregatum]KAI9206802.1 hypothetical protein BJ171DRAFT_579169 [Polychytrium aggregatum]
MALDVSDVVASISSLTESLHGGALLGVCKIALKLYLAVKLAEENTKSWGTLAAKSYSILFTLSQYQSDSPLFHQQAHRLVVFHQQIHAYFQEKIEAVSKLERVLMGGSVRKRIEQFCSELDSLWQSVMLALTVTVASRVDATLDIVQAIRDDEDREKRFFETLEPMLQRNQEQVLAKVGILLDQQQDWQIRNTTAVLQAYVMEASSEQSDKGIPTALLRLLKAQSKVSGMMRDEPWRILPKHVVNWSPQPIAEGGFGAVYRATYHGADVAVKQLHSKMDSRQILKFHEEISHWHQLDHPHVLKLLGACDLVEKPFMISAFMANGSLADLVSHPYKPIPVEQKYRLIYEVSSGMAYLHSRSIVHGDLKGSNVLINEAGRALIADFGMARTRSISLSFSTAKAAPDNSRGTMAYMAPELFTTRSSFKSDVYAFAMTAYEVFTDGTVPFEDEGIHVDIFPACLAQGRRPERHQGVPDDAWDWMQLWWKQAPDERPDFTTIMMTLTVYKMVVPELPGRLGIGSPGIGARASKANPGKTTDAGTSYNMERARNLVKDKPAFHPDWIQATALFHQSIVSGNTEALNDLAWANFLGVGVQQNMSTALTCWSDASRGNELAKPVPYYASEATFMLGWLHYLGLGIPRNMRQGSALFQCSAASGFQLAKEALSPNGRSSICGIFTDNPDAQQFFRHCSLRPEGHWLCTYLRAICHFYGFGTDPNQPKGYQMMRELANAGVDIAQCFVGECLRDGYGTTTNSSDAFRWFMKSANQGNAAAQNWVGICYYHGKGTSQSVESAIAWYSKSAKQHHPWGLHNLAECYQNGKGVKQDFAKAAELFHQAALEGNASSQNMLGSLYYNGKGVVQDHQAAVQWFLKAAENGHSWGQHNLGQCYHDGCGVKKDHAKAAEWLLKAARSGNASSQNLLGFLYSQGLGVPRNDKIAAEWFRKSAEAGNAGGQHNMGNIYHDGRGVEKNLAEAARWYARSAEQSYVFAQIKLGECYQRGEGVQQDDETAVGLFQAAAKKGNLDAQYRVGECYLNGRGVGKSKFKAAQWFRTASASGHMAARTKLQQLEARQG